MPGKILASFCFLMAAAALPAESFAHAMPVKCMPGPGAVIQHAPGKVTVRFDSDLEPLFSSLIVETAAGKPVSTGKGTVDPGNSKILNASVPGLPPAVYKVLWTAVSRDGHRTQGHYVFTVRS